MVPTGELRELASIELSVLHGRQRHGVSVLTTRPVVDRTHDGKAAGLQRNQGLRRQQAVVLSVPQEQCLRRWIAPFRDRGKA